MLLNREEGLKADTGLDPITHGICAPGMPDTSKETSGLAHPMGLEIYVSREQSHPLLSEASFSPFSEAT